MKANHNLSASAANIGTVVVNISSPIDESKSQLVIANEDSLERCCKYQ